MPDGRAVLMRYADGGWNGRIVTGEAAAAAARWLGGVELRPRGPGEGSGKPLAWLHLVDDPGPGTSRLSATRSVGLLTDVGRVLDRAVGPSELGALFAIFERDGQPFRGTIDPARAG